MKNIRWFKLGLSFLAIAVMVSCLKEEIVAIAPDSVESETIAFNAVVDWGEYADVDTKGAPASNGNRVGNMTLSSNDSSATLPVGIYVKDGIHTNETGPATKGSKITSSDIHSFNVWATLKGADQTTLFFPASGELFEPDENGIYHSDPAYFWPGSGKLDFVAVANAPANGFTGNINEAGTQLESFSYTVPSDATQQNDIVVATVSAEGSSNTSQPLHFEHIMSAVNFKIGQTMAQGAIKSIKINNIYSSGTYNVGTKTWTTVNNSKTSYSAAFSTTDANGNYEPNDKVSGTIINDNNVTFMMIPQVLDADAEVVVEFLYDNASVVKELRGNIALKGDGSSNFEWKKSTTTYYELSIDENYNLSIIPRGDVLDAHYVMTDITINVDTDSNQAWTLKVEATNIEGDDVSIEFKDKLNPLIKTDGYWINNIVEGSTSTSARGTKEIKGTTKGQHTITVFIPENTTTSDRKITLTLSLDSDPSKAKKTEYLYQMCPYWDYKKEFGWERVENAEKGEYGFTWERVVCYIFNHSFTSGSSQHEYFENAVNDLLTKYDASSYACIRYYKLNTVNYRGAVIIDYTKIDQSKYYHFFDKEYGIKNTQAFFEANNILAFEIALSSVVKKNTPADKAFRQASDTAGDTGYEFLSEPYSGIFGSNKAPYTAGNGTSYGSTWKSNDSFEDMSGVIKYIIKRNAFDMDKVSTDDMYYYSIKMDPNAIKWYLPAVNQYKDPVLSFATGNTTFTPANFWSSTADEENNSNAFLGDGTSVARTNLKQVVVQRIGSVTKPTSATVDNTSLAGGENGDTNQWL